MIPQIAPQFDELGARLKVVSWLSNCGRTIEPKAAWPIRLAHSALFARESLGLPEWEDWTLERRNDLTSFLYAKYRSRSAGQWNKIADKAVDFLASEIEPRPLPALANALPGSKIAVDAVRWDLASALMEAAYADCRPPIFFTHLIPVYEAGHLPVGWDPNSAGGTLLIY